MGRRESDTRLVRIETQGTQFLSKSFLACSFPNFYSIFRLFHVRDGQAIQIFFAVFFPTTTLFTEQFKNTNYTKQAVVHLKRKYQVARVIHREHLKNVLFDWSGVAVGDWLPILGKKFDKEKWDNIRLYISGSKARKHSHFCSICFFLLQRISKTHSQTFEPLALNNNLSLVAQSIYPGVAFDFRAEDDPVGQAMLSAKERIAIGLNQAPVIEGGKERERQVRFGPRFTLYIQRNRREMLEVIDHSCHLVNGRRNSKMTRQKPSIL